MASEPEPAFCLPRVQRREPDINLKQLRFFIKIAETGSITSAAEQLNLAQTALGQQMRQLEDSLEVKLLERHSRGVSLTPSGQTLLGHARRILAAVEEARLDVRGDARKERETVFLGITPSLQALLGADLLEAARLELPGVDLNLVEDLSFNLVDALGRGELTFALASSVSFGNGITGIGVIEEELVFVTGPGTGLPAGPVPFESVLATRLALVSARDAVWRIVHEKARILGLDVDVAFKVQSMPAIKALVARGDATSVMPFGLVAEDVEQGLVEAYPITGPLLKRTLSLAWLAERAPFAREREIMVFLDAVADRIVQRNAGRATRIGEGLATFSQEPAPRPGLVP